MVHIAITGDGTVGGTKFYKNGVLQTGLVGTLGPNGTGNSSRTMKIGNINSATGSFFYNGTIFPLGIYDSTLSQADITDIYNTRELLPTNLKLATPLDSVYLDSGSVYTAETVNNYRGLLSGWGTGDTCIVDVNGNNIQTYP